MKKKEELTERREELDSHYIPIDFDSYTIEDKNIALNSPEKLQDDDNIWRISSLTAYVDEDTKILILPIPESKRPVKIKDTKYAFNTIKDLSDKK